MQGLSEGKPREVTPSKVSLRHITVPDAKLRLEQALELLLAGTLFPGETIADKDLWGDKNRDGSAPDEEAP
jgi:hypothetical protein